MTQLSVNLNKIALLRNARGHDYPSVLEFCRHFIALGVPGITVHPRPDERHIRYADVHALAAALKCHPGVEFNIEGYPSAAFLALVQAVQPTQCTLVPDKPEQLTSDHGWDCRHQGAQLQAVAGQLRAQGIRVAVFLDPDPAQVDAAKHCGVERIELYTAAYAAAYRTAAAQAVGRTYGEAMARAQALGLGVNAGHDLNLQNLASFLRLGPILEVSIGHALVVECIQYGMAQVIQQYLALCASSRQCAD